MLIFVSDLHLVDHPGRASFDATPFLRTLRSIVEQCDLRQDPVKLVLLGDIFEILKSDAWHRREVRPWRANNAQLSKITCQILRRICRRNASFFAGLRDLHRDYGMPVVYVPGNHDALIGDPGVSGARALLRSRIPGLEGQRDEAFKPMLLDQEHGVCAEHGHELDGFNRREQAKGRFVPGDAVVIELLVGLPIELAKIRGSVTPLVAQFDVQYEFLHEIDNVEPQTLRGFLRWIEYQMHDVGGRKHLEAALCEAVHRCGASLRSVLKAHRANLWAFVALCILTSHKLFTSMPALRVLALLPKLTSAKMSAVRKRVAVLGAAARTWEQPLDLYVAGHTHVPLRQGFATRCGRRMTYLNSGTWRRVQAPALSGGQVVFQSSYQESVLCVHRICLAKTKGRYELRQYARG